MTRASRRLRWLIEGGNALVRRGRWRPAAVLLGYAIRHAPDHWEAHNNLAVALLKLERWEEAAGIAQRAIRLRPDVVDSHDLFGIALMQMQRWGEVVSAYRRALEVDPDRYDSYDRLGMALWRLERWDEVVETYESSQRFDDGQASARHRVGVALVQLGRLDAAVGAFRGAIELAEADPTAAGELDGMRLNLSNAEAQLEASEAATTKSMQREAESRRERESAFWTEENLGADVLAVERWLERLTDVSAEVKSTDGPRLLFVLDHDFGELTTVKFFVLGQELTARTTLLLPARLYVHNVDAIPGRTEQYATVDDVLAAVDRDQTDIVFLCAGYLLCEHLGFTPEDLARLVRELRQRGCRVVTADPYLGLLSKNDPRELISFEFPEADLKRYFAEKYGRTITSEQVKSARRAEEEKVWTAFARAEEILRDTYHLYPSCCDVTDDDVSPTDSRNVSFFNDRLLLPSTLGAGASETDAPRHWLFVLAAADWDIQVVAEGEAGFLEIVANKLLEARAAGRHPILIGPKVLVDELLQRMPTAEGIDILSPRPFGQFMSLLLSAEHVFYWNAVSHSLMIRLFNQLPIVLFDRGHLIRVAPAIHDRIVAWYYQGFDPPIRDHRERLTLETVEEWADGYRRQSGRLVEGFQRAPVPEDLVIDLMRNTLVPEPQERLSDL